MHRLLDSSARSVALGALVAAVVTLLLLIMLPSSRGGNEGNDFLLAYEPAAQSLIEGNGFRTAEGAVLKKYPPGYPMAIALSYAVADLVGFRRELALKILTIICQGLSGAILYGFSRSIYPHRDALIVVLLWVTCPFVLWLSKQPNSEIVFMPFLFMGVSLCWRAMSSPGRPQRLLLISLGAVAGISMLIRPIAIGLGMVYAVFVALARGRKGLGKGLLGAAIVIGSNLAVVFPWSAYVYRASGDLILLSDNGVAALRDGLTFNQREGKSYRGPLRLPEEVQRVTQAAWLMYQDQRLESGGQVARFLLQQLMERPAALVELFVIKAVRSWYATDSLRFEMEVATVQAGYLILALWGTYVAVTRRALPRSQVVLLLIVVLYFWALTTISLSIVRYMVPVLGLLFLLIPAAWNRGDSPQEWQQD